MDISSDAMMAEIYKGSLKSSGVDDVEIKSASGFSCMQCHFIPGVFGNGSSEPVEIELVFKPGSPVDFAYHATDPIAETSFDKACELVNNFNSGGFPFMCCLENDGIYIRALGFAVVPEQADPMLPVAENTRILLAENDAIIREIMFLANPEIFSDLDFSDVSLSEASPEVLSYDDALGMFDVIVKTEENGTNEKVQAVADDVFDDIYDFIVEDDDDDERRSILDMLSDAAATCVAISKTDNILLPEDRRKKLSAASNHLVRAIMPLAKSYDEGRAASVAWQLTPSDSDDFPTWGRESGTVDIVTSKARNKIGFSAKDFTGEFKETARLLDQVLSKVPAQFVECKDVDHAIEDLEAARTLFLSFRKKKVR